MNRKLYIGLSYTQFFWEVLLRIGALCGIIYFIVNYYENPVLMGVLAFLCLSFFLLIGDDHIIVYQDLIIQTNSSFITFIFKKRDKTYNIHDISIAYMEPSLPIDKSGAVIIFLLKFIVLKPKGNSTNPISIFFQLNNGNIVSLETALSQKEVIKIIETVNFQIKELQKLNVG